MTSRARRSFIFTPGLKPEMFPKALNCGVDMVGGEIFIPKLPSYNICQLANVIAPEVEVKEIGIRPGEKLHEAMIGESESYLAIECDNRYIIKPVVYVSDGNKFTEKYGDKYCPSEYIYSSGDNELISDERLLAMVELYKKENNL